ncbi:MAG: aminopeptidase P family protein [Erythrobacter sp.]
MLMQTHEARLDALRKELKRQELDGFVVPISDEHVSEYVGAYAQRLAWLTGFGGSAGSAIVLSNTAAMFVDGRYTVQVRDQVDGNLYEYCSVPADTMGDWLSEKAASGARIGFDPWLHTAKWVKATTKALEKTGIALVPVTSNPIDAVWQDRPEPSPAVAQVHSDEHAGQSSAEKRGQIAEWLKDEGYDGAVISALDSIAWLLNIRGSDVDHTPVALSYVVAKDDGTAELFIAPEKITPELSQHLGNAITIRDRSEFASSLGTLKGKHISVDPDYGVAAIAQLLEQGGADVSFNRDPTILPKAIKNPVEQQGHRDAQARDGAAVTRFLHWLNREGPSGTIDELAAAAKLKSLREEHGDLRDLSFDTISAAGPHAALPHYRVDDESNIAIPPSSIYLVDSGGQYLDGTTDITRTIWIGPGEPSAEMTDRNTRVLKGHIAIDQAVFPKGTGGSQLDSFARQFLWSAGVDFAHGTGHGVGSFLAVHEGPQRIAKAAGAQAGSDQALIPGMILSNEPGYYKQGHFGIRIENLVLTEAREIDAAEGEYFGFETLTFVPLDRRLIDKSLLSREEIAWVDSYHDQVRSLLAPQLQGNDLAWLEQECAPL